jgi:uncharacterized membrane protein YccC
MNLSAYNPFSSFDQLAIGIALAVVLAVFGFRILTGRPWRRTLPPDEIDADPYHSDKGPRP